MLCFVLFCFVSFCFVSFCLVVFVFCGLFFVCVYVGCGAFCFSWGECLGLGGLNLSRIGEERRGEDTLLSFFLFVFCAPILCQYVPVCASRECDFTPPDVI